MNKVIIIGCPGSGKTTFAEKLQKCTALPLYYLDAIWHKPDKTHIPREEFDQRITEIFSEEKWIIDGNYKRTIAIIRIFFFIFITSDFIIQYVSVIFQWGKAYDFLKVLRYSSASALLLNMCISFSLYF